MSGLENNLLKLYLPLVGWVGFGLFLGYKLPPRFPSFLGKFLYWVGVPLSILVFLRQADLSESVWIAPLMAWSAMLLGAGLAWIWIQGRRDSMRGRSPFSRLSNQGPPARHSTHSTDSAGWSKPTQGSFLLAAMVGNTGYLGYPVTLTLVGSKYFAWAIFYDTLGSTLGAYGLGVVLAARFGMSARNHWKLLQAVLINPAFWSFWVGLGFRTVSLPQLVEQGLQGCAWVVITLALLLIGMRLSQLNSWKSIPQASISLGIKMLVVPLVLGASLSWFGITGAPQLVIVLQMAMPPAFATLVIAEAYNLDRQLTVTALAAGSAGLLLTLPIWLWLFSG